MSAATYSKTVARLLPINSLVFVSESQIEKLAINAIACKTVGQKTFGLLSLPREWTLPFLGVSAELCEQYKANPRALKTILDKWSQLIIRAAKQVGINDVDEILVRSSGCDEGITRRGKFYSAIGTLQTVDEALGECLQKLVTDDDLKNERVPLLIQKRCKPEKAKGHLSNERRCYEEKRDWMGESRFVDSDVSSYFQVNLRLWRHNLPQKPPDALSCSLSTHVSEVLRAPAAWAYSKGARVHFEWVWDGHTVYLVQADEESHSEGHDPVKEHASRHYETLTLLPKCLKTIGAEKDKRFSKIANVFTYITLKLPTAPLYILDDRKIINQLSEGEIPEALQDDIKELVKGSLVIRTDIATKDLRARQLLPRTEEVRDAAKAFEWLVNQSRKLVKLKEDSAFLFHNFIPAQSAAFAYAEPNQPLVQIESLWGLPEGLYYNSHDKYVVDTLKADINLIAPEESAKFPVRKKRHFKRFFVSTTPSGKWETLPLGAPFDWKASLTESECRQIAYESRRIALSDMRPVSIMWFVGVPPNTASRAAIPWYHEEFDITKARPTIATRTKTPFDKCYLIQTAKDVANLKDGMMASRPGERIRVQPLDEELLRDKSTLKKIGELAKANGSIIVLEGAVLSHAYYQLIETGAIVEVIHPFIGFEERHGFNKLVRDKIPEIIRQRGEAVTTELLDGEALIMALKKKLVEEAYELLDAKDFQSVVAELADVREVVDTLMEKLSISKSEAGREQDQKHKARGGFDKGIVLIETQSLPPTSKPAPKMEAQLEGLQPDTGAARLVDEEEFKKRSELIEKKTDRRLTSGKVEIKANITVPVTRNALWSADTVEERIEGAKGKIVSGHVKGVRSGSSWNIEVSVLIDDTQLELL